MNDGPRDVPSLGVSQDDFGWEIESFDRVIESTPYVPPPFRYGRKQTTKILNIPSRILSYMAGPYHCRSCAADGEDTIPRGYAVSEFIQWIRNFVDRVIDFTDPENAGIVYGFDRTVPSWDPSSDGEIGDSEVVSPPDSSKSE